jgi:S1-C subfamily serine protease
MRTGGGCRLLAGFLVWGMSFCAGVRVDAQQPPGKSVIQLLVMRHQIESRQSGYREETRGTAFLISTEGRAITNSHVVDVVRRHPATYKLLAILGNEFYSARVICASALSETINGHPTLGRDIAEIQLTLSDFGSDEVTFAGIGRAREHQGTLPSFPALRIGKVPVPGDSVRVLGFGQQKNVTLPYEWSASGTVDELGHARDGTPVFSIKFDREAEPGHSGSPVLNMTGEVVGLFTWVSRDEPTVGIAISRASLDPACPG